MKQAITIVLPGDDLTSKITVPHSTSSSIKLGNGVVRRNASRSGANLEQEPSVQATTAGQLEAKPPGVYFVRQNLKRYYRPALEDRVIGTVIDRLGADGSGGEIFRLDIGGSHAATLSSLAFEGATKRNRPSLQPGQLFYARVAALHPHLDPVLSCQLGPLDVGMPRKDWMTNEGCYGELLGGTVCRITTGLSRELLHPDNVVLQELARKLAFEVAIGVNGFAWIHSPRSEHTTVIQNAIQNSSVMTDEQVRAMVQSLVYAMEKRIQRDKDAMDES